MSQWKKKLRRTEANEWPNPVPVNKSKGWDALTVRTTAVDGTALFLSVRTLYERQLLSEINVHVKLPDGTSYVLPRMYFKYKRTRSFTFRTCINQRILSRVHIAFKRDRVFVKCINVIRSY